MNIKRLFAKTILIYCFVTVMFYWIAKDDITYGTKTKSMLPYEEACKVLEKGDIVSQKYKPSFDRLDSITFIPNCYERQNTDVLRFFISDSHGDVLFETFLDTSAMGNLQPYTIEFGDAINAVKGKELLLTFESTEGTFDNGIGIGYGSKTVTNRGVVDAKVTDENKMYVNGKAVNGMMSFDAVGTEFYYWGTYYWHVFAIGLVLIILLFGLLIYIQKKEKKIWLIAALANLSNYSFLLKQMVERDFKTRYKRSILGSFWSLLNPLLAMAVQYFVFSTIFNSSIQNYPIYLLIGIIMYNFFNESVGMNVSAITGNSSLITKVYIPKYIFPLARVLSSLINLIMSLIPLALFLLITRTRFSWSWILCPIGLICLVVFSLGFGMLLCTMMVFFRDVAFLWGILSMFWMYLTPIFYSESIIPERFLGVYRLNPLLHYITFMRVCLIEGHSPSPDVYFACVFSSILMLVIGCLVFKKNQDKFVLNL